MICSDVYSEPSQRSKMEPFIKINNGFQPLTILAKSSILDVWLDGKSVYFSLSLKINDAACFFMLWWSSSLESKVLPTP